MNEATLAPNERFETVAGHLGLTAASPGLTPGEPSSPSVLGKRARPGRADASGRADQNRPTMPGRPSGDGRAFLRAALDGREAAVVLRRARDADEQRIGHDSRIAR